MISHEILPNLVPVVASSFLFTVLYGVGTYTAIAFLGLVNPEHWSWGSMLFEAQNSDAEISGYWWWYIPPGLMVALLGTALALLNFGIDEFINPRLRAAGLTRRQAKKTKGSGCRSVSHRFAGFSKYSSMRCIWPLISPINAPAGVWLFAMMYS